MKWRFLNFKLFSGFDWSLFLLPLLLAIFGIVIIFSITYGNTSNITLNQIFFTAIGLFVAICLSFFDYRTLKGLYLILYLIGIILLIFVLFLGSRTFGATRWINLYVFQLQPSEVFKIIAVIFLAKIFNDWQNELSWQKVLIILSAIAVPLFLI